MARTANPLGDILAGPRKLITVLKDRSGLSASLPEVLGAIGIGILLLGLVGFGVGAGISFAQDSGAKSTLESIKSAQILHQTKTNSYGTLDALTTATAAGATPALTAKPDNAVVKVSPDGRNYCAFVESTSMMHTQYWLTSASGKVLDKAPLAADLPTGLTCPTALTAP